MFTHLARKVPLIKEATVRHEETGEEMTVFYDAALDKYAPEVGSVCGTCDNEVGHALPSPDHAERIARELAVLAGHTKTCEWALEAREVLTAEQEAFEAWCAYYR